MRSDEEIEVVCPLCGHEERGFFDVAVYVCPSCGAHLPNYRMEHYTRKLKRIAGLGLDYFKDGFGY